MSTAGAGDEPAAPGRAGAGDEAAAPRRARAAGDRSGTDSIRTSEDASAAGTAHDDPDALVDRLVAGDRRALAKAISGVEDAGVAASELVKRVFPHMREAAVLGVTGPSGSGKSTLVDSLVEAYRASHETVGVLAVDPSSPFSGGALLGDRVRMQRHSEDLGVFVRSMATRGAIGGLAAAAYDVLTLMAAAGLDRLIVETVGVGQDEVDVAGVADTTCLVLTPGTGDEIQAIKAGIMEVADIFVLNKSDLDGADRAEAQLRAWIAHAPETGWMPPIVRTVAVEGTGVDELIEAVAVHEDWYRSSDLALHKRRSLAGVRLHSVLRDRLLGLAREAGFDREREAELIAAIADGRLDPHSAAEEVIAEIRGGDR